MSEIKLRGKLVNVKPIGMPPLQHEAEILLTPPSQKEIDTLKIGDKILAKITLPANIIIEDEEIVAILPQESNQEPKKIEKLDPQSLQTFTVPVENLVQCRNDILLLTNKINELVDAINKLREG